MFLCVLDGRKYLESVDQSVSAGSAGASKAINDSPQSHSVVCVIHGRGSTGSCALDNRLTLDHMWVSMGCNGC